MLYAPVARSIELIATWTGGGAKIHQSNPAIRPVQIRQLADQGRIFVRQMRLVDIRIECFQQHDFLWMAR